MMPAVQELRRDFMVPGELCPTGPLDHPETAIAIGAFDGFHAGHQQLIQLMVDDARARDVLAVVVTFDPDPDTVVGKGPAPKLLATVDRFNLLRSCGADAVVAVPFTRELAALDHQDFFDSVLLPQMDIASIHVGSDFRLGRGGASTVDVIRAWGSTRNIGVFGHHLVESDGSKVSATRIRAELQHGGVDAARRMLGRRYVVRGKVVAGRHEGTDMGFPTANVDVPAHVQMPAEGVYSGLALVRGSVYPAAINVGVPRMFAGNAKSARLEANIIGFSGDIYGEDISLAFGRFLREPRTFGSLDELIATVRGNIQDTKDDFGEGGVIIA